MRKAMCVKDHIPNHVIGVRVDCLGNIPAVVLRGSALRAEHLSMTGMDQTRWRSEKLNMATPTT
jgi:hypothetical protein